MIGVNDKMNNEKKVKKIIINNKEVEIEFYNDASNKKLALFIKDVDYFYFILKDNSELYVQQFIHALLMVKHFTNYDIDTENVEEFVEQGKRFTENGVLNQFAENFDKNFVNYINKIVITYFILIFKDVPEYLKISSNIKAIEQIEDELNEDFDDWDFDEFDDDFGSEAELIGEFPVIKIHINLDNDEDIDFDDDSEEDLYNQIKEAKGHSINKLLDEYNDYMSLYETFGDSKYKQRAEHILNVLREEEPYDEL